MVLEEVVELAAREAVAKTVVQGELVGRACRSHPLTPQLCLQLEVGGMEDTCQVQVLLTAQGLGAQATLMLSHGARSYLMG
jgi:hypothetical protein